VIGPLDNGFPGGPAVSLDGPAQNTLALGTKCVVHGLGPKCPA